MRHFIKLRFNEKCLVTTKKQRFIFEVFLKCNKNINKNMKMKKIEI